jgi:hypothetical protein
VMLGSSSPRSRLSSSRRRSSSRSLPPPVARRARRARERCGGRVRLMKVERHRGIRVLFGPSPGSRARRPTSRVFATAPRNRSGSSRPLPV